MIAPQLILSGSGLRNVRINRRITNPSAQDICNSGNEWFKRDQILKDAPFNSIYLILQEGEKDELCPKIGRISKMDKQLLASIVLDYRKLETQDRIAITNAYRAAVCMALDAIFDRYGLEARSGQWI
jgi:hypothetical protein